MGECRYTSGTIPDHGSSRVASFRHSHPLVVGESVIPLFISIPMKRPDANDVITRPLRWTDTRSPAIRKRFNDLDYFIEQGASYTGWTYVPSRARGKEGSIRTLPDGFKSLQVLVQPELGLYLKNGVIRQNDDVLFFYDMDSLPLGREIEAYVRLSALMEQGRGFVWKNARLRPKVAFWGKPGMPGWEPIACLKGIHQEIFQGDPECAPALGHSDMFKTFVHSAEVLEGMRVFFAGAFQERVSVLHGDALERERAREMAPRLEDLEDHRRAPRLQDQAVSPEGLPAFPSVITTISIPDPPLQKKSGIEAYIGRRGLQGVLQDEFNDFLNAEFPPRPAHGLQYPLYEEEIPASLFGRKHSRVQELALRLALSMPARLLGDGVGIPSTLVQKLAHQFYPDAFGLSWDANGKLDASGASKGMGQLVKRGVLEVADHSFRPGAYSKLYRALHPDLIAMARQVAGTHHGKPFSARTVDEVDQRWEELTGQPLAATDIDGIRDRVVYQLTNYCPSFEVFEQAALRLPGMRQKQDRLGFLPTQWKAHVARDQRRSVAYTEGFMVDEENEKVEAGEVG